MKALTAFLVIISSFLFPSFVNAADEVATKASTQTEICLYAGHYLQKQNGRCPSPPQGSCAPSQVECNRLMFNPVCVATTSNPAGTSSLCRELSNAQGFSFLTEFSAEQKAAFDKLHENARAYFVQERDRAGQRGISRKKASKENVEADEIYTRYLNLTSIIASTPAQVPSQQPPVSSSAAPTTNAPCMGPSAADFAKCDDQIKAAVSDELSGSCQLLLIGAKTRTSKNGQLQTYQWDSTTKKYRIVGENSVTVKFGDGGLAYGNRYFSMAPRREHRIERGRGQTPIGIYGGLLPVSDAVKDFRCVTDPGSQYFNSITTKDNNIGKSSNDSLQYPYALMLRYPANNQSKRSEKNAACLMIHSTDVKSCGSRGCMSMATGDLEKLRNWLNFTSRPAVAVLPEDERKNLSSCLPGLGANQLVSPSSDSRKTKAKQ